MARFGSRSPPRKRVRDAAVSRRESRKASMDPYALVGLGAALTQCDHERDIARLAATAVTSALSVPFGAVALLSGCGPEERAVGQLDDAPLEAALAHEIENLLLSSSVGAHAISAKSSREIEVREESRPQAANAGLRRLLAVRVGTVDTSLGGMIAGKRSGEPFAPEERAILETLAGQASMAVHRIQLSERMVRQTKDLAVLNTIAAAVSRTMDPSELLDLALEQVVALTGMEGAAVLLVNEETQRLTLAAARNFPQAAKDLIEQEPLPMGQLLPGITAERCQLLILENAKDDERELPLFQEMGIMTHVCIPLAVRGRALGVLGMIDRQSRSFSPSDLALFTAVGEQLGSAIERAWLYEQSKELTVRLQAELSERERAEQTLRGAALFAELNPAPVLRFDHRGMVLSANTAALAILGEEAKKSVLLASLLPSMADIDLGQCIREGLIIVREAMVGQRHFQFIIRGIPDLGFGHVYGSDITERKRAEEALHVLNKQLADANRHKSEFLANLSHELRTPLNAILGASELLVEGLFGQLTGKQAEYVRDIHEGGTHLLSLINDVLDLSKVEAGKLDLHLSHFDLRSLMESSCAIVRERAASKSLEFNVIPPPEDVVIEADERKIKQVVYNLLSNAVKFTPEKGRVDFRAHRDGDEVLFAVEDTGPGVAKELRESIFEEFVHAPGDQEGTGLGLPLSERLVELHGGRIWLESQVGQGSRFLFAIPIAH